MGAFSWRLRARPSRVSGPVRAEAVAVGAILLGAVVYRCWGLHAGLPGAGLLNPDEATVVPRALGMLVDGTLDPGWFLYPSLYLMLLAGALGAVGLFADGPAGVPFASPEAFAYDPVPYLLTGRLLSVTAGVLLVLATWALGRRAYGPVVGLVAAAGVAVVPVTVAYSHMAVTDMSMVAALTAALWLLVGAVETRSRRRLLAAAAVLGAATSLKYNAGVAVVPLVCAAAWTYGPAWPARLRGALLTAAVAAAGFVAGTPFSVITPGAFLDDFARQNRIVADGWLGFEDVGVGWWFNLRPVLWGAIGGGLVLAAVAGLVLAGARRRRADLVLAPYALGYFVYVSVWSAHFDRYLLPIVPVLVVLGARAGVEVVAWTLSRRGRAWGVALGLSMAVALVLPAGRSAQLVARYARPDLRLDAVAVIAHEVPVGARLAVDPLGPPLLDLPDGLRLARAGHVLPYWDLERLETPQPGVAADRRRNVRILRRAGVRWVVTSDSIRSRVRAAAPRYPVERRFYRDLERTARLVMAVPASLGPGIRLWDLGPRHTGPVGGVLTSR